MSNLNINKCTLGGRLTRDPELRYTPNQIATCSFSVAVNRKYKSQDGNTQADFINCVAWRQSAETISKYFQKGSSILVVGPMQTRSWEDSNGNTRYATELIVEELYFVDSKSERIDSGNASKNSSEDSYYPIDDNDEAVPF